MSSEKRSFAVEIVEVPDNSTKSIEATPTPSHTLAYMLDRKEKMTTRISEQSRYVGFGITIACFALLTSDSDQAELIVKAQKLQLILCAIVGCVAVLCDVFQYVCAYISTQNGIRKGNETGIYEFDDKSNVYIWQNRLFWSKQIIAMFGGFFLLYILITYLCPEYGITNIIHSFVGALCSSPNK